MASSGETLRVGQGQQETKLMQEEEMLLVMEERKKDKRKEQREGECKNKRESLLVCLFIYLLVQDVCLL